MINEYYILRDNEKHGPYSHTELMDMQVSATELVLSPLATDWQEAAELPEFDEYFKSIGVHVPTVNNVANFGWRLLAYIIDNVMVVVAAAIVGGMFGLIKLVWGGGVNAINMNTEETSSTKLLTNLLFAAIFMVYHSIFESTKLQGSIGKVICKMAVVDINGQRLTFSQALQRNLSKLISSLLCGIGFLACIWSPMQQCWHDQIAKTFVVRKPN
ncbi:RDD family protein [Mucilaginibacter sp. SG564]|uniref:RDD family protein n=1 Tax=unclassified Mucilaginibacter TaxID=2617802 RepID=UPI0015520C89|nr:RDD family protein [Mucilaginibacter sp. SG564]NOW96843.1 putative RDD family membrane protein YckC [Mucilaginibacter sp. SG564]